jgi:hypothetical protein
VKAVIRAIEFKSLSDYESWLRKMGDKVRIVNVSTTKRWSLIKGFLGDNKSYTITYEVLAPAGGNASADSDKDLAARQKFLAAVVTALIAALALRGWASLAAIFAVFLLFYAVPLIKGSTIKRLAFVGVAIIVVTVIKIAEVANENREERESTRIAEESASKAAEQQAASNRAFAEMTPAAHLSQVRNLLEPGAPPEALVEANKHIAAIPSGTAEARAASILRSRFVADLQKKTAEDAKRNANEEAAAKEAARIEFAKTVENQMLDQGWDFEVTTAGVRHTTLKMKWVLASKVIAHQLSEKRDLFETARQLGFERMELTDGFEETWTWRLAW